MKQKTSIKLKAAFLLMIFALNTVVGFACAIGLDMGFNTKHHDSEEATEAVVHIHKDGKRHVHQAKKENHSHEQAHRCEKSSDKDNCCNNKVKSFEQLDKSVPNTASLVHPVFFTPYVSIYHNIDILAHTDIIKDIKPFVRSYHPPIPNIRIAIQSFQI